MIAWVTGIGWITAGGRRMGGDGSDFVIPPGELPRVRRDWVFDSPYPHFGRMDDLSRLGLAAMGLALKDARLFEWTQKREIGIVSASVYGCLQTDLAYFETVTSGQGLTASPALFSYTLPNCFLGEAAVCFGLTGPGYVINESNPSGMACLHAGLEAIAGAEVEKIICGICDLGCPPGIELTGIGPGGAVFLVLERILEAGRSPYGGLTMDRHGVIFFNGKRIETLVELTHACLALSPESRCRP